MIKDFVLNIPKYPIVLCHGLLGFKQIGPIVYFHKVTKPLKDLGVHLECTSVHPTDSIRNRAEQLYRQVIEIADQYHTDKVHLIAHSMGGLDSRYAISHFDYSRQLILSLVRIQEIMIKNISSTLSTPHRGSYIADWSLHNITRKLHIEKILKQFDIPFRAIDELSPGYMNEIFNPNVINSPNVTYQSYGAYKETMWRFSPLSLFHYMLKEKEGDNDGPSDTKKSITIQTKQEETLQTKLDYQCQSFTDKPLVDFGTDFKYDIVRGTLSRIFKIQDKGGTPLLGPNLPFTSLKPTESSSFPDVNVLETKKPILVPVANLDNYYRLTMPITLFNDMADGDSMQFSLKNTINQETIKDLPKPFSGSANIAGISNGKSYQTEDDMPSKVFSFCNVTRQGLFPLTVEKGLLYPAMGSPNEGYYIFVDKIRNDQDYTMVTGKNSVKFNMACQVSKQTEFKNQTISSTFNENGSLFPMISVSHWRQYSSILFINFPTFNLQYHHKYPIGFGKGTTAMYQHMFDFYFHPQISHINFNVNFGATNRTEFTLNNAKQQDNSLDAEPPVLESFVVQRLGGDRLLLSVVASDLKTGVQLISILDQVTMNSMDIVNGDVYYGTFKGAFSFNSILYDYKINPTSIVSIMDYAGNWKNYTYGDIIDLNFNTIPLLFDDVKINQINSIKFTPNVIDTSKNDVEVQLSIGSDTIDSNWIPKFGIVDINKGKTKPEPKDISIGSWNFNSKFFELKFMIKRGKMSGQLDYLFQYPNWNSQLCSTFFNDSCSLTVENSGFGDEIGPMIKTIDFDTQQTITPGQPTTLSFVLNISDPINGFKKGYIELQSDRDPLPYSIEFYPTSIIAGTIYDGIYKIYLKLPVFPVTQYCLNQIFKITYIKLEDISGNININEYFPKTPSSLDTTINLNVPPASFINNLSKINLICPIHFYLKIQDIGLSGISVRHHPTVLLQGINGKTVQFTTDQYTESKLENNTRDYHIIAQVPYGFGIGKTMVNVFGLMDESLNFNGYTSRLLEQEKFPYMITVPDFKTPIITNHVETTGSDNYLTIRGYKFASELIGIFDFMDGTPIQTIDPETPVLPNEIIFKSPKFTSPTVLVKLKLDEDTITNPYLISATKLNFRKPCLGNPICSGNGNCTNFGCDCNVGWEGPMCDSKILNIEPTMDDTNPVTQILLSNEKGEKQSLSQLSVLSIRELSFNNNILFEYPLKDWSLIKVPAEEVEEGISKTIYSTRIKPDSTQVNVSIDYYTKEKAIVFANETQNMYPFTIKFSISLSSYNFSSFLNRLQIVMSTSIESLNRNSSKRTCFSERIGFVNELESDLTWIEMAINNQSIYGKFIKNALIDDRLILLSYSIENNSILNINDTKSRANIQITIPYYRDTVLIDPNFSVLVNPNFPDPNTNNNGNSNSSRCFDNNLPSTKSKGIPKALLIGLLVGIVGGCSIITVVLVLTIKHRWWLKYHIDKLFYHRK
eukprot:gene4159-5207_t